MSAAGAAGGGARALAGLPEGYNWFLILAAVVVAGLVVAVNVYVLVHYMHLVSFGAVPAAHHLFLFQNFLLLCRSRPPPRQAGSLHPFHTMWPLTWREERVM